MEDEKLGALRKEASEKIDKLVMRSCWNCNSAHKHLKELDVPIACIWCGHYFYKGIDITEP